MTILEEINYQLTVKCNMKMVTAQDSFTTVGNYLLTELVPDKAPADCKEYILEEKSVVLTQYFNPVTLQIMDYVNKLASIYSRLHLWIGNDRRIRKILNLEEIRDKWEALKNELMLTNPMAAFEVVRGKDREMKDVDLIKENISNTHFFYLFLYLYGYEFSSSVEYSDKREERDRMGIGFYLPKEIKVSKTREPGKPEIVRTNASMGNMRHLDKKTLAKVTGQENLELNHFTKAIFKRMTKHKLLHSEMEVFEQINIDYKTDLSLKLEILTQQTYGR